MALNYSASTSLACTSFNSLASMNTTATAAASSAAATTSAAKEAGETKIEKLAEGQQAILDQIGQLLQAASRLRKRVPTYDSEGNISEVNEAFID